MQNFQFLDIILLAMVAGFIAFRLYSVLGRRTGHERSPDEQLSNKRVTHPDAEHARVAQAGENVVPIPDRGSGTPSGALGRALMDIKLADRRFDTEQFLTGARAAYEMIVTAFAQNDRETLRPLLSDDVYATFESVIAGREERYERVDLTFEALKSARITAAEMKDHTAEITVTFESDVVLASYDKSGTLIEGEPKTVQTITDIWTFARDAGSRDPNWILIATTSDD